MKKKKEISLKMQKISLKKKKDALFLYTLFNAMTFLFFVVLFSFLGGRVLAYKHVGLLELKILLLTMMLFVFSIFFSKKTKMKKREYVEISEQINVKKHKRK